MPNTQIRKKQSNNTFVNVTNVDPTVTDDESVGYDGGSGWFNTVTASFFICEDPTAGAAVWTAASSGGGGTGGGIYFVDQSPLGTASTYGAITGVIDSANTTFVNSEGEYIAGSLVVILNGLELQLGTGADWVETDPATGTFDFVVAPAPGDIITCLYRTTNTNQVALQFEDEGVPLGGPGSVDEFDVTGAGASLARVGNKITLNVPGGSSINIQDITLFEDFLNGVRIPEGGSGTDINAVQYLYATWDNNSNASTSLPLQYSIQDHPGIIRFSDVPGGLLRVFQSDRPFSGATDSGGIPIDNDFELEILTRNIYNVSASSHTTGYAIQNDGNVPNVSVRAATGNNDISYRLFAVTGTTTIPPSGTWFKIKWVYLAGTLSLYIDNILINSEVGVFGANTGGVLEVQASEAGGGSIDCEMDLAKLNYQVTR